MTVMFPPAVALAALDNTATPASKIKKHTIDFSSADTVMFGARSKKSKLGAIGFLLASLGLLGSACAQPEPQGTFVQLGCENGDGVTVEFDDLFNRTTVADCDGDKIASLTGFLRNRIDTDHPIGQQIQNTLVQDGKHVTFDIDPDGEGPMETIRVGVVSEQIYVTDVPSE